MPKSQDKNLSILRMKRAFKMKWKAFFNISETLSLKQKQKIFLKGESPTLINLKFRKISSREIILR